MTLHQQTLTSAPVANRSGLFRLRALFCEQRARKTPEPTSRQDWEELAIEWHCFVGIGTGGLNTRPPQGQSRSFRAFVIEPAIW